MFPLVSKLVKSRHALSRRDRKCLLERVKSELGGELAEELSESEVVEKIETRIGATLYVFDGEALILERGGRLYPTILCAVRHRLDLPTVVVDMGAVSHIVNGADVMVPGIVSIEGEFERGDVVVVVDEEKSRAFCVGEALMASREILEAKRGRAIKNVHHARDKLWELVWRPRLT